MQCPNCKAHDVVLSPSSENRPQSHPVVTARCQRCCHLFSPTWWSATQTTNHPPAAMPQRRAA